MDEKTAMRAANKIIAALCGRKGFDHWWSNGGDDADESQKEIRKEIAGIIQTASTKTQTPNTNRTSKEQ